jgi:hypothetical protein
LEQGGNDPEESVRTRTNAVENIKDNGMDTNNSAADSQGAPHREADNSAPGNSAPGRTAPDRTAPERVAPDRTPQTAGAGVPSGVLPNKASEDDPKRWGDQGSDYDHDAWLQEQKPPHWG